MSAVFSIAILARLSHAVLQIEHYFVSAPTASLLLVSRKVKQAGMLLEQVAPVQCLEVVPSARLGLDHHNANFIHTLRTATTKDSRTARQEVRAVSKCPWELLPHTITDKRTTMLQGGRPGVKRALRDALPATEESLIHRSTTFSLDWCVRPASEPSRFSSDARPLLRRHCGGITKACYRRVVTSIKG